MKILDDDSILASGKAPDAGDLHASSPTRLEPGITGIRLEALPDPSCREKGRAERGTAISSSPNSRCRSPKVAPGKPTNVKLQHASADFSQSGFDVAGAIDGKPDTGWAVLPEVGKPHVAIFETESPLTAGPKRVQGTDQFTSC